MDRQGNRVAAAILWREPGMNCACVCCGVGEFSSPCRRNGGCRFLTLGPDGSYRNNASGPLSSSGSRRAHFGRCRTGHAELNNTPMKSLTEYLWFEVPNRRGFVNITATVEDLLRK